MMAGIIIFSFYLLKANPCGSSPCLNGGTCRNNTDLTDYKCDCLPEACPCAENGKNCESK